MWLRLCTSIVLVYVIQANLAKHASKNTTDSNKHDAEAIFASVIKNISRVNHVLQELISNYKHLQKIYNSQEESLEESSDGEIDKLFRNKRNRNGKEKSTTDSVTTPKADGYPATQMIWSENDKNEEYETEKDNVSYNNSNQSDDDKIEIVTEKKPIKPSPLKPLRHVVKKAEIIFVDTHKPANEEKKKIQPIIVTPTTKGSKTRYEKVSQSQTNNQQAHKIEKVNPGLKNHTNLAQRINKLSKTEPMSNLDPKRNVEKHLHSKAFPPINIWDQLVSNKQLRGYSELTFQKMRKDNSDNSSIIKFRKRSDDVKPSLDAREDQTEKSEKSEKKIGIEPISDSDEGAREKFQATVLRKAYGDACLKVVIKKCYKGCKEANKAVCQKYKCKAKYKNIFDEYVKTGCIKEFHGNVTEKTEENKEDDDSAITPLVRDKARFGLKTRESKNLDEFEDITRNGYLRSCLPHIQANTRRSFYIGVETPNVTNSFPNDSFPNLNILRDKYERACQRISYEKCKSACEFAYTKVCESFTCNAGRKKAYKRHCSAKCKTSYRTGHSRASDTDSSGSSDSSASGSSDSSSE